MTTPDYAMTCTYRCPHKAAEPCHLEAGHTGPHELRTTHVPGIPPRAYCTWKETRDGAA